MTAMKMAPLLSGRRGRGWWVATSAFRATTPDPSLIRRGIIFMHGVEPRIMKAALQMTRVPTVEGPNR